LTVENFSKITYLKRRVKISNADKY